MRNKLDRKFKLVSLYFSRERERERQTFTQKSTRSVSMVIVPLRPDSYMTLNCLLSKPFRCLYLITHTHTHERRTREANNS